jgi:hypothetical protein
MSSLLPVDHPGLVGHDERGDSVTHEVAAGESTLLTTSVFGCIAPAIHVVACKGKKHDISCVCYCK